MSRLCVRHARAARAAGRDAVIRRPFPPLIAPLSSSNVIVPAFEYARAPRAARAGGVECRRFRR